MDHGPPHAAVLDADKRSGVGQHAVVSRRVGPVGYRFPVERGHAEVQHHGVGGGHDVAAVAESFAVGAVRLHDVPSEETEH